jgi:uncharacterized protein (DUF1810 family)
MEVSMPDDPYNLARFLDAQAPCIDEVFSQLRNGRKTSHWMWFIFPQLRGLGSSWKANYFGISSLDEAIRYMEHALLAERLRQCAALVNQHDGLPPDRIFGDVDAEKFWSSMTLFAIASPGDEVFSNALRVFFDSARDPGTLGLL